MNIDNLVLDGHIHMGANRPLDVQKFLQAHSEAGFNGGLIISVPPAGSPEAKGAKIPALERMKQVKDFCNKCGETYFPCFWIDPLEKDAVSQVKLAKEMGMKALKVICTYHAPSAGLPVYQEAVKYNLPILFHSGILWDGESSGKYNRPCEFECMQYAPGCRFALAHISWPWTDECIALFGKLKNAGSSYGKTCEIYIDSSPGTPDIYRKDVFYKFACLGYDLSDRLIFGIDSNVHNFNVEWGKYTLDFDRKMFTQLNEEVKNFNGYLLLDAIKNKGGVKPDQNQLFQNAISKNLLRFLGEI